MKIEDYSFGAIKVDGQTYTKDIILYPDKVETNWIRKESHSLAIEDLKELIDHRPEVLVVGTGAYGVMKIPVATMASLKKLNIRLIAEHTANACNKFNEYIDEGKKVIGVFHLTC